MTDLVRDLRVIAGMISMGERISWGSDSALMEQAADEIEALRAQMLPDGYIAVPAEAWDELVQESAERDALRAQVARLKAECIDVLYDFAAERDARGVILPMCDQNTPVVKAMEVASATPAQCLAEVRAQAVEDAKEKYRHVVSDDLDELRNVVDVSDLEKHISELRLFNSGGE